MLDLMDAREPVASSEGADAALASTAATAAVANADPAAASNLGAVGVANVSGGAPAADADVDGDEMEAPEAEAPGPPGEDAGESSSEEEESSDDEEAVGADGMTEYERQRQRNIQRNRELMMSLSLSKMANKLKAPEDDKGGQKKRGPRGPWKKKRGEIAPSRGSSRIQRLQEERKHTAWKEVHVETSLHVPAHPQQFIEVEVDVQCLGVADPSRTLPNGALVPAGFVAEGMLAGETLVVWTDMEGQHHVMWGESEGEWQRHVETEEGGADTPAGASLCVLREMQRRRLEKLGAIPGRGTSLPLNIRLDPAYFPALSRRAQEHVCGVVGRQPQLHQAHHSAPQALGNTLMHQLPRSANKAAKAPKTPKAPPKTPVTRPPKTPYLPAARYAKFPDAPHCHNCGARKEDTQRMRFGPAGPKTLCNACGMYWATQGRPRPTAAFADDYPRRVPEGEVPAVTPCARAALVAASLERSAVAAAGAAPPDLDQKVLGDLGSKDSTPPKSEQGEDEEEPEGPEGLEEEEQPEEDEKVEVEEPQPEAEEEEEEEEEPPALEDAPRAAEATPALVGTPVQALLKSPAFFTNMVKCAAAGLITPAMVGADEQPELYDMDVPPPRWAPHLYAALPPMVAVTEDACAEVKSDPQGSQMAKAIAAIADSDPVIAAAASKLPAYPMQAHYAGRSAAVALAGWGAMAAASVLGSNGGAVNHRHDTTLFPTSFILPNAPRPRAYIERDIDGVILFAYTEPDVQMALQAQLEKYREKLEAGGEEGEAEAREEDMEEAVAALDLAVNLKFHT